MIFKTSEKSFRLLNLLVRSGATISKSEAKRAIRAGLVAINGKTIDTKLIEVDIEDGLELKVGESVVKVEKINN